MEDKGFSGSLTAVTATVTETADPKAAETEQNTEASTEEQNQDTSTAEDASSEETQEISEAANDNEAGSESVDGIPAATNDAESSEQENENSEEELEQNEYQEELQPADETGSTEKNEQDSEEAGSTSVEGIPEAKEDGTYNNTEDNTETESPSDTDEASYQAEAEVGDGSSDVLAFGTVVSGQEDEQAQYVTIKNTGTETLNFIDISPEHFAVQDITEPLEAGQSVQVWIAPRVGTEPGSYEDTITYKTEEGATASFKAQMTVESEDTPEPTEVPQDTPTPEPTETPQDTPTPEPTETPQDTPTSEPTQVPAVSKVNADTGAADFGSVVEGYTEAPQAQTITLTNEGNADAVLSDIYSDQGEIKYFDAALSAQEISANGGTATFTVRPKNWAGVPVPIQRHLRSMIQLPDRGS